MNNLIGTALGAFIDRRDGDSGIKGAVLGSIGERTLKVVVPLVAAAVVGWTIQHYWTTAGSGDRPKAK